MDDLERTRLATDAEDFRLSRIYAQGWNAAREFETPGKRGNIKNPHPTDPERSRWNAGFVSAHTG